MSIIPLFFRIVFYKQNAKECEILGGKNGERISLSRRDTNTVTVIKLKYEDDN